MRFAVTSLATAQPVAGAQLRVEGVRDDKFVTLAQGTTDASGFFSWSLASAATAELRRVVVDQGARHAGGRSRQRAVRIFEGKLVEAGRRLARLDHRIPSSSAPRAPRTLCHLFTERPIYRPEEPVHIKGYVRSLSRRRVEPAEGRRNAGRQRSRQSGMAHSGQARRGRRLLSQIRRADAGDRRLCDQIRTRRRRSQRRKSRPRTPTRRRRTTSRPRMATSSPRPPPRRKTFPAETFRSRRKPIACRPSRSC